MTREPLNKWLRRRSAALRGARPLAYLLDMSRVLRSVRLASHPARSLIQRFPRLRLPNSFEWLMLWHGLFVGAYTIAWFTAEGAPGLHEFSGYAALGLLVVRLLGARIAGDRAPWALPIPKASMWKSFGSKLISGNLNVLRSRTPFSPLSGLVILGALVLVTLSGLAADWWEWEDLHEGMAEGSLALVLVHIAIVSLAPLLKRLGDVHGAAPRLSASTHTE